MADFNCSFCGRSHRDAATMISGPAVFICDECVGLCVDILVGRSADGGPRLAHGVEVAAKMRADLDAAEAAARAAEKRTRGYEAAIKILGDANTRALEAIGGITHRCTWCGELCTNDSVRDHVAACERHPAVIRLREYEAAAQKKVRRG